MAAIFPAVAGAADYIDPQRGLPTGPVTGGESFLVEGSISRDRLSMVTEMYYFASVGDGDTWATAIQGIVAAFWLGDANAADGANATIDDAAGQVTFFTSGDTVNGWVLLFIDPSVAGRQGRTAA